MYHKLVRLGEEFALVIDKSVLAELNIDESTPLDISVNGRVITIRPLSREEVFERALESVNERYAKTFRRLAEED